MRSPQPQKAVIYCRVSSTKQVRKGDGLGSQETRCREYASYKSYEIEKTFHDKGVSGGLIDRPGMQDMLAFLRKHKRHTQYVVIIDDISRLARGLEAHIQLRTEIGAAGGKLESPSIEFGEDSDSQLVENLLASVSQHQRQKNAEQVVNRMRARVMNGYWCFSPTFGYKYERVSGHGKLLVRDEPVASIVTEALEGYASRRFESRAEVQSFLEAQPVFPRDRKGRVHLQRVHDLLTRSLYAGYIDVPKWGISLHPGKHEPLISFETWQRIQNRLKGHAKAPARKDISDDFPLRGFVTCACCHKPMTAAWSKGRNARYPYYFCQTKGCSQNRKAVRKEQIEGEFEELLKDMRPAPNLFFLAYEMMRDLWQLRLDQSGEQQKLAKSDLLKLERKTEQLMDRLVEADSPTLVSAYEKQIKKLEENKIALSEKIEKCGRPVASFEDTYRTTMQYLSNPWNLWVSDKIEHKRMVLRLTFADRLPYLRGEGYRTAETTLPFKVLSGFSRGEKDLVEPRTIDMPR